MAVEAIDGSSAYQDIQDSYFDESDNTGSVLTFQKPLIRNILEDHLNHHPLHLKTILLSERYIAVLGTEEDVDAIFSQVAADIPGLLVPTGLHSFAVSKSTNLHLNIKNILYEENRGMDSKESPFVCHKSKTLLDKTIKGVKKAGKAVAKGGKKTGKAAKKVFAVVQKEAKEIGHEIKNAGKEVAKEAKELVKENKTELIVFAAVVTVGVAIGAIGAAEAAGAAIIAAGNEQRG